ncbi:hypothetical protein LX36DRAFT_664037 [Colletotrichum falcatum]|nr:hypothetical protein LX36DRAFT_664037 [Colletotrichum falcatum]
MTGEGTPMIAVVAGEDKRIGAEKRDIKKCEEDVEKKGLLLLEMHGLTTIYCHTAIGTAFRTWILDTQTRRLNPLFGPDTREDRRAYVEYRTTFGQYEWNRLGSYVKDQAVRPLAEFTFRDDLSANYEWNQRHLKKQREQDEQIQQETNAASQQQSIPTSSEYYNQSYQPPVASAQYPASDQYTASAQYAQNDSTGFVSQSYQPRADQGSLQGDSMSVDDASDDASDGSEGEPEGEPAGEPVAGPSHPASTHRKRKQVRIRLEEHTLRSNKYTFKKHTGGRTYTTKIEDWHKQKIDGKEVWTYIHDKKYWGYKPAA